jgi:hypothetical protein
MNDHRFKVAISFAGAEREYATRVEKFLQAKGVAVFLDSRYRAELWGTDLAEQFVRIYSQNSDYVLMLISDAYVNGEWTRLERRAAISRALKEKNEFILPVRFDDSWPDGMPTTTAYERANKISPEELAALLCKKLGINPMLTKASHVPPPQSLSKFGDVTFDYESYNHRYVIGDGTLSFETAWSSASAGSIHAYNDPSSIQGIALASGAQSLADIVDASKYDFTSRSRTPRVGEFLILRNSSGFYAAVKILEVTPRNAGKDGVAVLKFFYIILDDGGSDFSKVSIFE